MPHDKLTADGKKLKKELEQLKNLQVRIGFQRGKKMYDNETDMCDVALFNELGTSKGTPKEVPSRPFLRQSVDDNSDKINALCKSIMKNVSNGSCTAEEAYKKAGVYIKGLVQEQIKNGEFEANKPSTIKKKGSDKPLIDTGQMRQSVNFVICKKGECD